MYAAFANGPVCFFSLKLISGRRNKSLSVYQHTTLCCDWPQPKSLAEICRQTCASSYHSMAQQGAHLLTRKCVAVHKLWCLAMPPTHCTSTVVGKRLKLNFSFHLIWNSLGIFLNPNLCVAFSDCPWQPCFITTKNRGQWVATDAEGNKRSFWKQHLRD